jgi:NADPH:quinone reductase-like Zn-dependent oxidoreductase
VHGAAGGVGTAAVQLAAAAGAWVTATVRNPALREEVGAIGSLAGWTEVVADDDFVDRGPFHVVLELIGAPNMAGNLEALATGGRIAVIGVGGGGMADINLLALMHKRGRIHGSTLRARPLEQKAEVARRVETSVVPLLESDDIRVPIAARFPLEQAAAAYARFAEGGKLGKIVLTVS